MTDPSILATPLDDLRQTADAVTPSSFLQRQRRRRAELERGVLLDIPIPGYDGELVARFPKLSPDAIRSAGEELARGAQKSPDDEITAGADLLVRNVREVCGVASDNRHVALDPDSHVPLKFDRRLAHLMNLDDADELTTRQIFFAVLGRGGEAGVIGMARRLLEWSAGVTTQVRETLEGESPATPL